MMLSRDKVLSKQILSYHRIPTPHFAVFRRGGALRIPKALRFPLFVKSATEDASLGISQASIVEDAARLAERVEFIHAHTQSDALVEEYVEGREFYVGVIGNERIRTLPPWEFIFGELKSGRAAIATRKAKWDRAYQKRHGISSGKAGGTAGRSRGPARPARAAHLPRAAHDRLRAHRLPRARGRHALRARGERQPEPRARGGLRGLGAARRHRLSGAAAEDSSRWGAATGRSGGRTRRGQTPSATRCNVTSGDGRASRSLPRATAGCSRASGSSGSRPGRTGSGSRCRAAAAR